MSEVRFPHPGESLPDGERRSQRARCDRRRAGDDTHGRLTEPRDRECADRRSRPVSVHAVGEIAGVYIYDLGAFFDLQDLEPVLVTSTSIIFPK